MRIAFVNATKIWSGVKTWILDSAAVLTSRGHDVVIYCRPGNFPEKARCMGLDAVECRFGPDLNPFAVAFFAKEFKRRKIDIVICNISKDLRTGGIAARLLDIPVVHRLGDPQDVKDTYKTRLTLKLLNPSLLACSEYCRQGLLRNVPAMKGYPFAAIHLGVDCTLFPRTRAVHTPRTVITTCRLDPEKGHINLFRALAVLRGEGFDFRLRVVGKGHFESQIKAACTECGLDDIAVFTGFTTAIQNELNQADIYVLPSDREAYGVALVEAMASSLPCIARRGGGPDEIWPREHSELLISTDTPPHTAFADALRMLLAASDKELQHIGQAFRASAEKEANRLTQVKQLESWLGEQISAYRTR